MPTLIILQNLQYYRYKVGFSHGDLHIRWMGVRKGMHPADITRAWSRLLFKTAITKYTPSHFDSPNLFLAWSMLFRIMLETWKWFVSTDINLVRVSRHQLDISQVVVGMVGQTDRQTSGNQFVSPTWSFWFLYNQCVPPVLYIYIYARYI